MINTLKSTNFHLRRGEEDMPAEVETIKIVEEIGSESVKVESNVLNEQTA